MHLATLSSQINQFTSDNTDDNIVTVHGYSWKNRVRIHPDTIFVSLHHIFKTSSRDHTTPYPEGRESDHLSPSNVEIKGEWSCICTSAHFFMRAEEVQ